MCRVVRFGDKNGFTSPSENKTQEDAMSESMGEGLDDIRDISEKIFGDLSTEFHEAVYRFGADKLRLLIYYLLCQGVHPARPEDVPVLGKIAEQLSGYVLAIAVEILPIPVLKKLRLHLAENIRVQAHHELVDRALTALGVGVWRWAASQPVHVPMYDPNALEKLIENQSRETAQRDERAAQRDERLAREAKERDERLFHEAAAREDRLITRLSEDLKRHMDEMAKSGRPRA
jgi:hypothetical protein